MKIALIGYGKMGKAIEEIALQQGHEIVLKINSQNKEELFNAPTLQQADVAIEFTAPDSAIKNIECCLQAGVPIVCGTTGWTHELPAMLARCEALNGSMVYASNFSIGVNLFFELNKKLTTLMAPHPQYEVILEEIHHTQKKDAPSGTALSLAEQILAQNKKKKQWVNDISDNPADLEIISQRIDPTPGTHRVKYASVVDDIEITHTAHNRTGFAAGAILAAMFIQGKKGTYTMREVLGL
ncbi:MAG: 4-hydroxy-tetrahydrodipicolinate reductase [Bacteroidetes bacterium]|nr:4-hydroxy-tetrahydrodipicolinate reductase [Bacteroidota bacterium]